MKKRHNKEAIVSKAIFNMIGYFFYYIFQGVKNNLKHMKIFINKIIYEPIKRINQKQNYDVYAVLGTEEIE